MKYTKLTFTVKTHRKPYLFIGSTIRGMLGYALKDEVCINPSMQCSGCFAAKECAFYAMYEVSPEVHHYRLSFALDDPEFRFSILLFDTLRLKAKSIENALSSALKKEGYDTFEIKSTEERFEPVKPVPSVVKLTLLTPLRIKRESLFVRDTIRLEEIVRSIRRRERLLRNKPYKAFAFKQKPKIVSSHFYYKELTRRSNKQHTKMNIGGLMGEIVIGNVDKKLYKLLKKGEITGVGKATTFGLGTIKIEEIA